jgi:protoporphyrinogen oxidase
MQNLDVVVGGGIAGLLAALLSAERDGRKVMLIEREPELGGLLRFFDYGPYGRFDYGMHNMYETGIPALDELLFGLLPEHEWQLLEGSKRDLAGLYLNGALQENSPFPDIRRLQPAHWDASVSSFFRQIQSGEVYSNANAHEDARTRLGDVIADSVIDPALRKQFGRPAKELAVFSTRLTTLSRVVMFDERPFADLMASENLRDRLAYPEQRTLPEKWSSGRRAYYPKAYGIYRVIEAMVSRLKKAGVEILTSSNVRSLETVDGEVQVIQIATAQGDRELRVDRLVWTSGLPAIAALTNIDMKQYKYDPARKTIVVNLLLRKPPVMGDLFYFYCYEPGFHTFRVTNFGAYCYGAEREHGHPIAVELLMDEPLPSKEAIGAIAIEELLKFGVIKAPEDVAFQAVEILAAGFPMPTKNNFDVLSDIRDKLLEKAISNLVLLGIMSEENIFFQRDVLSQTYTKLSAHLS